MNYPKLGKYQRGGPRPVGGFAARRKARNLKQRFKYLDRELKRGAMSDEGDTQAYNEDTDYNRRIKAGMSRIARKQRIMEAKADVRKARRSKRVNRKFESLKDVKKAQLKSAKASLKTAKSQDFGRRKSRKEMIKTGKGANLGPSGPVTRPTRVSPNEMQNYGKMRGGRTGFRGKARTKKIR